MDGVLDTIGIKAEEYPFPIDSQRVALLEKFINDCQQHHIRLVLIESPMYICSKQNVFQFVHEFAEKHHISFLDHYRDSDFVGHAEYFYDFGHLNREGAQRFSEKLSKEFREIRPAI